MGVLGAGGVWRRGFVRGGADGGGIEPVRGTPGGVV